MRQVKIELTNTVMESTSSSWDGFKVNNISLGEHIINMLESGKFIGSITVSIKETAEYIEPETEEVE